MGASLCLEVKSMGASLLVDGMLVFNKMHKNEYITVVKNNLKQLFFVAINIVC